MGIMTCVKAVNAALTEEMARDQRVVHFGIDVAKAGGPFKGSAGLLQKFGSLRVRDTPISEGAFVAIGVGAALAGLRPVVHLMFSDFLPRAWDEIVNQAAKARYMFDNACVPLTVMAYTGGGFGAAAQHSQSFEAMCAHVPGLKVVCPANPADCKGLLKAAIRDDNPVVFLESKVLLNMKGEVPDGDTITPIGLASVARFGRDVTIVAVSRMVQVSCEAAKTLSAEGIEAEVVDVRSIYPLDIETIQRSVTKTGRLLVVHEAPTFGGIGAEIVATIAAVCHGSLTAAPARLGAPHVPTPFAPNLEAAHFPSAVKIVQAVRKMVRSN